MGARNSIIDIQNKDNKNNIIANTIATNNLENKNNNEIKLKSTKSISNNNNSNNKLKNEKDESILKNRINYDFNKFNNKNKTKHKEQKLYNKSNNYSELTNNSEEKVLKIIRKHNSNLKDSELINNCLMKHFFMKKLDSDARNEIIKQMSLCEVVSLDKNTETYSENVYVCRQGKTGFYFYIIKEGSFQIEINKKYLNKLEKGDSFGELALIHSANRSASIKCVSQRALLYVMERRHFRKIIDHINIVNFEENKRFLKSIPILANIDPTLKSVLANNLIKEYYEPNQKIVKQNNDANSIYLIKEGSVRCEKDGKLIRKLRSGDYFGEASILTDAKRTMDVISDTKSIVYDISVNTLKNMLGENYKESLCFNFINMALSLSKYFYKINTKILGSVYEYFKIKHFKLNETVLNFDDSFNNNDNTFNSNIYCPNKFLTVVIEGNIVDSKNSSVVFARRGDILFEEYVIFNKDDNEFVNKKARFIANPDCIIATIFVEDLLKNYDDNFDKLFYKSDAFELISQIPLFKNFNQKKIENLCDLIKTKTFENGKTIITQGKQGNQFYIVKKGVVDIFINNVYVRSISDNGYFGERALFFKESRSATAIASGEVDVFYLEDKDFLSILEPSLKDYLYNRFYLQDSSIEIKDLDYLKDIGKGSFGSVSLVMNRKNKHLYALKCMSKSHIDYENLHANVNLEKSILLKIDHPFIVKLVKTLKDNWKYVFFLLEYVRGKELFDVIRDIGFLNDDQNKFFSGSMLLAVDYLHERKIIYRDIKPENVIVCENGFIKLIDFGTAKQIEDRTSTIIGTPHYMAPEVIMGEGYTTIVDFWSIAVCMFEFICAGMPFGDAAEDPLDVYNSIINEQPKFPGFIKNKLFIDLVKAMLVKNPLHRITKFNQITNHPYFSEFSFENLLSFNINPPFIPKIDEKKSDTKPMSYAHYIKTSLTEFKIPNGFTFDKKRVEESNKWYRTF